MADIVSPKNSRFGDVNENANPSDSSLFKIKFATLLANFGLLDIYKLKKIKSIQSCFPF